MRVGLIGCGAVGAKRADALASLREPVLCADRDHDRATSLARRYHGRAVRHWHDVVGAGLDAIIIATTPDHHAEIACASLERGTPVLIEKPAGRSAADGIAIVEAARHSGRQAKAGFNHRFHPAVRRAKELIEERHFGVPLFMRAVYGHGGRPGYEREWRFDPTISGGGETVDQGSHLIDLARWFLGDLELAYAATPCYFWTGSVEDNCFLALRGSAERMAWLHASWTEWKNHFRLDIVCMTGTITIEGLGGSYGVERLVTHRMRPEMGPPVTDTIEFPEPDRSWSLEWDAFTASLDGAATPIADITDAVAVATIVDAAYCAGQR